MLFYALLVAVACASTLHAADYYRESFASFMFKYGKNYVPGEKDYRMQVFMYNMDFVERWNQANHRFELGPSPFADMTNTEFATSKLCGCMLHSRLKPSVPIATPAFEGIDWREHGAVMPVKNQRSCGSCWAFSATGALEGGNFVHSGELVSLSEQQLVDCDMRSSGCNGGLMEYAFEYVSSNGLCKEEDYPYEGVDGECRSSQCESAVSIAGYENVPENDGEALKRAVSQAPVSVAIEADSTVFQLYTGGVIDSELCGTSLNHGVLVVGYEEDYWIVKNSWGPEWGEEGYVRIRFEEEGPGICGINKDASYPTFYRCLFEQGAP